ncbi:hypothetical protein TAMA11512_21330 [Selenomonas sp. TAMA-11512]|uniref:hypothetical protein n=1 Tax=Selenomonas sp. TAMA-11512 TaxID=3095337 RepID=UPI00308A6555|nr:hypothetical protein TAMA11512_21330 [Selenomonas sp. TAMA-11512]
MPVIARQTAQGTIYIDKDTGVQVSAEEVRQRVEANTSGGIFDRIGKMFSSGPSSYSPELADAYANNNQEIRNRVAALYAGNAMQKTDTEKAARLNEAAGILGIHDDAQKRALIQSGITDSELMDVALQTARQKQNSPEDWDTFVADNPATAKYLTDQKNMAQSWDDIKPLKFVEDTVASVRDHLELADIELRRSEIGREMMHNGQDMTTITADQRVELENINKRREELAKKYQDPESKWYNPFSWNMANIIGGIAGMANDVEAGLVTGAGGAAIGAGVGLAGAGVGAIPGALTGFGFGFRGGLAYSMGARAMGNQYLDSIGEKSADGRYMSADSAYYGALLAGGGNAVLGAGGITRLFSRIPASGEVYAAFKGAVPEAVLNNPETKKAAWKVFVKNLAESTAEQSLIFGGGTKAVELAGRKTAEELSGLEFDHSDEPGAAEQILHATTEFVPTAVTLSGVTLAGGAALRTVMPKAPESSRPATSTADALNAIDKAVSETKTARRSKNAIGDMIGGIVEGSKLETVGIPAKEFVAYFQEIDSENVNRAAAEAKKLGVTEEELQTALQQGQDINVKTSDFIKEYSGTEHIKGLAKDVRMGEFTDREIAETTEYFKELQKQAEEMAKGEGIDKESPSYQKAVDYVRSVYPDASERIIEGQANLIHTMFTRAEDRGLLKVLGYKDVSEAMDNLGVVRREAYDPARIADERASAQTLLQAMKLVKADGLYSFFKKVKGTVLTEDGRGKIKYEFNGTQGSRIALAHDDAMHIDNRHGLTEKQWGAIQKNSENFIDGYLDENVKGDYNGVPVLAKIKTPLGNAGVCYEVLPNGKSYLKTAFFDSDAGIDNWMKKNGSNTSLLDESRPSNFVGNPFSLRSIHDKLFGVNGKEETIKLHLENPLLQDENKANGGPLDTAKITGAYIPAEQGKAIIELYKNANYSTLPHEMMHHFVNLYQQAIETGRASEDVVKDFRTLNNFVGAKDGESWTASQQEKVTSAFEAYLSEGKAPSLELVGIFEKFKGWMKKIYNTLTRQQLPINDDIRQVFDRMLASEEQLNAAELFYNSERLFGGKELGLKEMKDYTKLLEDAHREARKKMEQRILKEFSPAFKKLEKEARAKVTFLTEAAMHREPLYAARLLMEAKKGGTVPEGVLGADFVKENGGGLKLNRAQAVETYGEKAVAEMPQRWFTKDGQWTLDDIADIVGMKSGDELRQAVLNNRSYAAEFKDRVDARMAKWKEQELGNIQDLAVQMVTGERTLEAIGIEAEVLRNAAKELRAKNEKATAEAMAEGRKKARQAREAQERTDKAVAKAQEKQARDTRRQAAEVQQGKLKAKVAREIAKETIGNQRIAEAGKWRQMLAAATRAGKKATRAMAKGDYDLAIIFKDEELLQRAMAMQAMKAEKEIQVGMRFFGKINKRNLNEKSIDHNFNVQIDNLLAKYGLLSHEPLTPVDGSAPAPLAAFIESCRENYFVPIVPESIVKGEAKHYSRLSLNEFRDLKDGAKSLQHVGKMMDRALSDADTASMKERTKAIIGKAIELTNRYPNQSEMGREDLSLMARLGRLVDIPINSLVKTETLLRIIDKGEEQGPAIKYIFNPIIRGLDDVNHRNRKSIADIEKVIRDAGWDRKSIEKMKGEKHHFDFLPNDLTMEEIVLAAMNWGNEGNRDRLRYYFKSPEQRRMKMTEMENQQIDQLAMQVFSVMEEKHWKLVQGVWDYLNTYAPEIRQHEIDCAGLDVKMVEPTPFRVFTKDGVIMDMSGGYYPIAYDPGKSIVTMNQQEANQLFKVNPTASAMTSHGHTSGRVSHVNRPLLLNWSAFTNHIQNVNYDLAMRKPVIDVNKIIKNPDFISAIDSRFGVSTTKALQDWLINIAADQRESLTVLEKGTRWLRTRMSVAMLGFRVKALAIDLPQNVVTACWQMGAGNVIKGMGEFYTGNFMEKINFVNARSAMMREKTSFMDQNMADFRNHMFEKNTVLGIDKDKLVKAAFCCDMVADMAVNYPMWIHMYSKAIAEGKGETEAATIADSWIRRSSVDTSKAGLSKIQRGGEGTKLMLPFYSFFNSMFNRIWFDTKMAQIKMEDGRPMDAARVFTRMIVMGLVIPMTIEGIMNYALNNNRNPDPKKREESAVKSGVVSGLSFPFQMFPIVGGGISYGLNKMAGTYGSYELSPIETTIEKTFGTPPAWYDFLIKKGGDPDAGRKALIQTADTASLLVGYPMKINTLALNCWDAISKGDITLADFISRRSGR